MNSPSEKRLALFWEIFMQPMLEPHCVTEFNMHVTRWCGNCIHAVFVSNGEELIVGLQMIPRKQDA